MIARKPLGAVAVVRVGRSVGLLAAAAGLLVSPATLAWDTTGRDVDQSGWVEVVDSDADANRTPVAPNNRLQVFHLGDGEQFNARSQPLAGQHSIYQTELPNSARNHSSEMTASGVLPTLALVPPAKHPPGQRVAASQAEPKAVVGGSATGGSMEKSPPAAQQSAAVQPVAVNEPARGTAAEATLAQSGSTPNSAVNAQSGKSRVEKPKVKKSKADKAKADKAKADKAKADKAKAGDKPTKAKKPAKSRQVEVVIEGIDDALQKNARSYLSLIREETRLRSRYQVRRLVTKGRDEISSALEVFGYYSSEVESEITNAPDGKPAEGEPWKVRFIVTAGERVTYDGVIVKIAGPGAQNAMVKTAVDELKIETGDPLLHQQYEGEKRRILEATRHAGYLDAKYIMSQLRVNPDINKVTAELRLVTGALFEFGAVEFEQDVLDDELVMAFVPFKTGDLFDTDKLIELQLALNDSRYFSRVEVDIDRDGSTPAPDAGTYEDLDGSQQPRVMRMPVSVALVAGKSESYKAGVGYGTDTGGRVTLGYENRRVNKAGHTFKAETRVSELSTEIAVRYALPVANKATDRLSFDNSYTNEKPADEGKFINLRSELRFERVQPRLRRSAYLAFEREKFELGNDEGSSNLLIPGAGITWLSTSDRLRPKFGMRLTGDVHGAAEGLLTDTTFLQMTGEAAGVYTIAPRWRALGRSRLVYTILGDGFENLPASERQFAGGTGSVRGYGYQKLAPTDETGDVIGGRYLSTFSTELEYQFAKSWAVAAFFDTGGAGAKFMQDLSSGAGMGVRWILPFGQVRLDVAMPLTGDDNSPRVHISLGPDL